MLHAVEMGPGRMICIASSHDDLFRYFSNLTAITATVSQVVMLVLVIEGYFEVRS
jgi:hypothetical protein